ncbi:MAG: helix-turn-helix protein [Microvirga sp.]|jgi:transcriptional regulator with XRE-family HTH domain|nr:helix-turn-helix protein [Microvirga sp.]
MKLPTYLSHRGLTATDLAKRAGVAQSTITRTLNGEVVPGPRTRARIVAATGGQVTERDLLVSVADAIEERAA